MKIRTDFVTNSSSSSFVIAYRTMPDLDEDTLAKYPFLKNYGKLIEEILFSKGNYGTTSGKVYKTKEEWDEHIIDNYGWSKADTIEKIIEEEEMEEQYNKIIECLNKGFNILDKDVDYSDDYCVNMIHELATDEENFIILQEIC